MAKEKTPPKKTDKTVRCPNCEKTAPVFENSKGGRYWKCEHCGCWGGLKRDGKPAAAQAGATEGQQNEKPQTEKPETKDGGRPSGTSTSSDTGKPGGAKWYERGFTI